MASSDYSAIPAETYDDKYQFVEKQLSRGVAIPAHPLALTPELKLDERRQRALSRYYIASGAGGLAVGVHTTQFKIHDPEVGLLKPVWQLAAEEMDRAESTGHPPFVRVAGICGDTSQAVAEASLARELGYQYGLVSLSALKHANFQQLVKHCRAIADVIKVFGFYLQPAVGGRELPYAFWREFCSIQEAAAIKVAAFNRYQTLSVVRAVAESGREDIALYTGNDDNIVLDLITPFRFRCGEEVVERRFVGGLLGHWAVWTTKAVELLKSCHNCVSRVDDGIEILLQRAVEVTDCNAAIFDAANNFRGCQPGILEILRRQGLLAGTWRLDEHETISRGQIEEIDRVIAAYPYLTDDRFVAENLDAWLNE